MYCIAVGGWSTMSSVAPSSSFGIVIILVVVWSLAAAAAAAATVAETDRDEQQELNCNDLRQNYRPNNSHEFQMTSVSRGNHLKVCASEYTCCSSEIEASMKSQSLFEFSRTLNEKINFAKQTFVSRTAKFDAFFVDLLNKSRQSLQHASHSSVSELNAPMFNDLFRDLRSYYKGTDLSLSDTMDRFFSRLALRLFMLVTAAHTESPRDDPYVDCVDEQLDKFRPFGRIPYKLKARIHKPFVTARNVVRGLAVGRDAIMSLAKFTPRERCVDALTRLLFCPLCQGHVTRRPCLGYCLNTMHDCLLYQADANAAWNDYLGNLRKLISKLEGPLSMEMIAATINIGIDKSIRRFNENAEEIKSTVYESCGRPPISSDRTRNPSNNDPRVTAPIYQLTTTPRAPPATSALGRLVHEARSRLEATAELWQRLPGMICIGLTDQLGNDSRCWDGPTTISSEDKPDVIDSDASRLNTFNDVIYRLQIASHNLKAAEKCASDHCPDDINWIDSGDGSEDFFSGSGAGRDEIMASVRTASKAPTQPTLTSSASTTSVISSRSPHFVAAILCIVVYTLHYK